MPALDSRTTPSGEAAPERSRPRPRRVAVVGGGIAGLVAARDLDAAGFDVTLFEAGDRLGGQIRTERVAGLAFDVGAEALHVAGPRMSALLDDLDLTSRLVTARAGSALIWDGTTLRGLPAGVGPTGPTRLAPVLRSRILSPAGLARAAVEPFVPRSPATAGGDESVGRYLERRFGPQVVDRLVDPMLGSLHSGDVRRLGMRAVAPHLAAQADSRRSLVLARRARRAGGAPQFRTLPDGLQGLSAAILAGSGVTVRMRCPVRSLGRRGGRYVLGGVDTDAWDGVVLAAPPARTAELLRPVLPDGAATIGRTRAASVATVVVAVRRRHVEHLPAFRATGLLVPSRAGRVLKAATFSSRKWAHLDHDELFLIRLSAGRAGEDTLERLDDAALVDALLADLSDATGLRAEPAYVHAYRWADTVAQLEVGHVERVTGVRRRLDALTGIALAGAGIDGLGISACVGSGAEAAAHVTASLLDDQERHP